MCQECQQKEIGRPWRIALAVLILGWGGLMIGYIAMYHDDLFRPFREHRIKIRMEALKVEGYTSSIGPSISWQSEGRDIPIDPGLLIGREFPYSSPAWHWQSPEGDIPSPPPEPPDFRLPPAK